MDREYDADEIFEFLNDTYYTDYEGRVELLMDSYEMSEEEARGWIDEWNERPPEGLVDADTMRPVDPMMSEEMKDVGFLYVDDPDSYFEEEGNVDIYRRSNCPKQGQATWVVLEPVRLDKELVYNIDIEVFDDAALESIDGYYESTVPFYEVTRTVERFINR